MTRSIVAALFVVAGLGAAPLAAPASAQDAPHTCRQVAPGRLECDRVIIEGRRQEPGASVVLTRGRGRDEATPLRASFVRGVVRSVEGRPF